MDRFTTVLLRWLAAALIAAACSAALAANQIRGFTLTVSNLDASVAFYEEALGFRRLSERTASGPELDRLLGVFGARVRSARLQLGDEFIELEQYVAGAGAPIPLDSRSQDLWFQHFAVVVSDMDRAWSHVSRFPIRSISSAPQTIPASNTAAAGIRAVKFRDPDGHPLELLWFPADKGNPKWQQAGDRLFLGIDHSAITVANTERSTAFWRDVIGLSVAGGSLNTGATQEHLDSAFGARVQITGLRPKRSGGPGLEFLHYLTPSDGRAAPALRPGDLAATRTVAEVDEVDLLEGRLQAAGVSFVSAEAIAVTGMPWSRGLIVRDPDGHLLQLVQP